jgi:4-hydroxy-2-oxoglutarate aldolase
MPSAENLPTNNGHSEYSFAPGIHVPSLTWFKNDKTQEIDWDVQEKHFEFLISNGLHGIVIAGTNGEAATLSSEEKMQLVQKARKTAQRLGRGDLPITIGGVAGCTRDTIRQTKEAKEAGATAFLALVPSYFHFAMNQEAMVSFFQELADDSPIPIVIYNFPGVVAGLDINSEMLDILGKHKNIVAVKLTCGGIAKVARISASFKKSEFVALAGQSDWLIPALSVGGVGTITGVANLYPKVYALHHNCFSVMLTLFRLAFTCTTSGNKANTMKHLLYKLSSRSLNGASARVASTALNGLWPRSWDTPRRAQTADGRIQNTSTRARGNGC